MPSGLAESARRALKEADTTGLVLQRSARSQTGFTNVIPVKDKFQARLQVAGDGRGGVRKRKQHSLPRAFSARRWTGGSIPGPLQEGVRGAGAFGLGCPPQAEQAAQAAHKAAAAAACSRACS